MGAEANEPTPQGSAMGAAAAAVTAVGGDANTEIESAYRVIDEYLQEGRRAAQARSRDSSVAAAGAFAAIATDPSRVGMAAASIQEMVAQGIRFYSTLAPLWTAVVSSIASSAGAAIPTDTPVPGAAPLHPPPLPRGSTTTIPAPVIIELASARMTRVTVDLTSPGDTAALAIGGLHAIESERPPLRDIRFASDSHSGRPIVRIRVPDDQLPGVYSGVIVDADSGEPRGTIWLRIET